MKTIWIIVAIAALIGGIYYLNSMEAPVETPQVVDEEVTEDASQEEVMEPQADEKLDMAVVCESALAYMTFDGESAEAFVAECMAGEHPEVIERYKADMEVSAEVAI